MSTEEEVSEMTTEPTESSSLVEESAETNEASMPVTPVTSAISQSEENESPSADTFSVKRQRKASTKV